MSCTTTSWEFFPEESRDLLIDLSTFNSAHDCKKVYSLLPVQAGRKIEVTLPGEPDDLVFDLLSVPPVTVDSECPATLKIALTPTQLALMRSGSVKVKIDWDGTGSNIKVGTAVNVIKQQKVPDC